MPFLFAVWRLIRARPAAFKAVCVALACVAAVALAWHHIAQARDAAVTAALAQRDAQERIEINEAIKRAAPRPRPSDGDFVECLRNGAPGCL